MHIVTTIRQTSEKLSETTTKDTNDVVNAIRQQIADYELQPGARLPEKELSEEFGVTRARVREVLGVLEQRGLVDRLPNRGAVVKRLELPQIIQIFELREALEGMCARLATEKSVPEDWHDLIELFGAPMDDMMAQNDFNGYLNAYQVVRDRAMTAADNPLLAEELSVLYDRTKMLTRRIVLMTDHAKQALIDHRNVLKAMADGDADKAEATRRQHIRHAREAIERYYDILI